MTDLFQSLDFATSKAINYSSIEQSSQVLFKVFQYKSFQFCMNHKIYGLLLFINK